MGEGEQQTLLEIETRKKGNNLTRSPSIQEEESNSQTQEEDYGVDEGREKWTSEASSREPDKTPPQ